MSNVDEAQYEQIARAAGFVVEPTFFRTSFYWCNDHKELVSDEYYISEQEAYRAACIENNLLDS